MPPAYNPAFKVIQPPDSGEEEQSAAAANSGPNAGRQQPPPEPANQRRSEEAKGGEQQSAAEKPKQFGVATQQKIQHLDQPSMGDMNPLQMRSHLRSQLKKSRKVRGEEKK